MEETRLGAILLEGRIIGEAQLQRCLEIQALTGGTRPLGQILLDQGMIEKQVLDQLLELQRARRQRSVAAPAVVESDGDHLQSAIRLGASDLVVGEGRPVLARLANEWRQLTAEPLYSAEVWDFVRETMGHHVLEQLAESGFVAQELPPATGCRGRITAFRQFDGVAVTVRLHPMAVRSCAELGVPDGIIDVVRQARGGLLLVAGERGTGRSEVLASMIHEAAAQSGRYVWVLDEATEYPLPETGAMVVRRQTRSGGRSAVTALRAALREDPDVIVIGDAGSSQLLELALRGAEGGRLVIAGLHATQAIGSIQGVLDHFNEFEVGRVRAVLAATLHGVLVRRLLPDVRHQTMLPATEVLLPDAAARDIIRGGDLQHLDLLMRMPDGRCGHRIDQSLLEFLASGQAAFEDVFACAEEKAWVLERAAGSGGGGAGGATGATGATGGNKEQKG